MRLSRFEEEFKFGLKKTYPSVQDLAEKIFELNPRVRYSDTRVFFRNKFGFPITLSRYFKNKFSKREYISAKYGGSIDSLAKVFGFLKFGGIELQISGKISDIYNKRHIKFMSCMYRKGSYFEQLDDFEGVSIAYLTKRGKEFEGQIYGRVLIWQNSYVDRIYCHPDLRHYFKFLLSKENKDLFFNKKPLTIPIELKLNRSVPYLDTFQYYNKKEKYLTSKYPSNVEDYADFVGLRGLEGEYYGV